MWGIKEFERMTWHRAIFPWGNPQSIFAAATFHESEFGKESEWSHRAQDTRKQVVTFKTA